MSDVSSANAIPVLVIGDSRRNAIQNQIAGCVNAALNEWVEPASKRELTAQLSRSEDISALVEMRPVQCHVGFGDRGEEHLVVAAGSNLMSALFVAAGDADSTANSRGAIGDEIRGEIVTAVAGALSTALCGKSLDLKLVDESTCLEAIAKPQQRWWKATMNSASHGEILSVWLSSTVVSRLVPATKSSGPALSRRRAAIADETVQVQAVLGEATVSVGELASLAVNDVIVLVDDISTPGYLVTDSGRRVGNVSIGRVGVKRAAAVTK